MEPVIKILEDKMLVGKRMEMSVSNNRTMELWKSFMPRRNEIKNTLTSALISLQVYDSSYHTNFDPDKIFEKWAAIEVADCKIVPNDLEVFTLLGGLYAVFYYKGLSTDASIYHYIYATWLPNSGYVLDDRPHFEVLGENYKNNDPNSEEEIWIPIRKK
ncbi:AraC family transcriptional regulator [Flavobacteriaceae bacterium (ex Bugula neritina AB1)]|nr:AraC family transcriptional regulator [Flavobacteriaceae bacterium (ex Bugula neritina AB1)]